VCRGTSEPEKNAAGVRAQKKGKFKEKVFGAFSKKHCRGAGKEGKLALRRGGRDLPSAAWGQGRESQPVAGVGGEEG